MHGRKEHAQWLMPDYGCSYSTNTTAGCNSTTKDMVLTLVGDNYSFDRIE